MNKALIAAAALVVALVLPAAAMAAVPVSPYIGAKPIAPIWSVNDLIELVFNVLWLVFGAFAVFMFMLAGIKFLNAQGDPDVIKEAKDSLLWGSVGVGAALLAFGIPMAIRTLVF